MSSPVRAGGGVVWRRGSGSDGSGSGTPGGEFVVVHRPRYDDWTFPKGKAAGGESDEASAEREVLEETGFTCERGPEVATVAYEDHLGRPKTVRYWLMYPARGAFAPNDEVDELRWVDGPTASGLLSYEHDRWVLETARSFDRPVFLVRHAKAGDRDEWSEDDALRPLSRKGRAQAEGLVALLHDRPIDRIVSSPAVRCVQTVRPLGLARAVAVEEDGALAEGVSTDDALALVRGAGGAVVHCSHGDVIPSVVQTLEGHGMAIVGEPLWKKGSTWMLSREGGLFTEARSLGVPPDPSDRP